MTTLACKALLFDLDGTLIDSLEAVDRAWRRWAILNGMDPDYVVGRIHGRRSIDSIRILAPELDAERQDELIRGFETTDTEGVKPLPGVREFIDALPQNCWAVVTSGTGDVAGARLKAGTIPHPPVLVVGGDVANGKPAPDPFLLAAERLGVRPSDCLAFEDARPGIRSAKEAGMIVIGVSAVTEIEALEEADFVIRDFRDLKLEVTAQGLAIEIREPVLG